MQYGSTLQRKTPLKRKPLSALHPEKRQQVIEAKAKPRKPLKKISKSQRRRLAEYYPIQSAFLRANPMCLCCEIRRNHGENILQQPATEVHHKRGRVGALLTDTRFFIPTCYQCGRNWIHNNPTRARQLNLLSSAVEWNTVPED